MMKQFTLATAFVLLLGMPTLQAQLFEVGGFGGVSRLNGRNVGTLGVGDPSPTENPGVSLADGWNFGFRMTINSDGFYGHEFGYAYNRTQLRFETAPVQEQGMAIHQGFYHFLLYGTREGSRVRPFVSGGGHFSNFVPPGASAQWGGGDNKFGVNYGGGVKVRLNPMWGIRLDVREFLTGKPFDLPNASGNIRQLQITAGLSLMM
jgi:hypothetical protein